MGIVHYHEAKKRKPTPSSTSTSLQPEDLPILYNTPLSTTKEKKANLLNMCKYLPNEFHDFYRSLPIDE
jgi:hypothetical protein